MADDILDALRLILGALEAESPVQVRNDRGHRKRLKTIRGAIKEIAMQEARAHCNCRQITTASSAKWREFSEEMNTPCPLHGVRHLGIICAVMGYGEDRDPDDRQLARLLRDYEERLRNSEGKGPNEQEM